MVEAVFWYRRWLRGDPAPPRCCKLCCRWPSVGSPSLPWRSPEAVARALRALVLPFFEPLGGLLEPLGPLLERLGASGRVLERSWNALGASWSGLGALLERSWRVLESSCSLLERCWRVLERSYSVLERSWSVLERKTLKNHENHWFFNGFSRFLTPAPGPKPEV